MNRNTAPSAPQPLRYRNVLSLLLFIAVLTLVAFGAKAQEKGNAPSAAGNYYTQPGAAGNYNIQQQDMANANYANYGYQDPAAMTKNPHLRPGQTIVKGIQYLNDNQLLFEVHVLMNVKANRYTAIFSLTRTGDSLLTLTQDMDQQINGFRQMLKQIGIGDESVYVDVITQLPVYGYNIQLNKTGYMAVEKPIAFELKKNVHVLYKDPDLFAKIMNAAAANDIFDLVKVDYFTPPIQTIHDSLRTTARAILADRVESMEAFGLEFEKKIVILGEDIASVSPQDNYSQYSLAQAGGMPSSNPTLSPAQQQMMHAIQTAHTNQHTTYFYNKIAYDGYDAVINPVVLEPPVQYSYYLRVKYTLKPDKN